MGTRRRSIVDFGTTRVTQSHRLLARVVWVYFLLIPGWKNELRGNWWHFASRCSKRNEGTGHWSYLSRAAGGGEPARQAKPSTDAVTTVATGDQHFAVGQQSRRVAVAGRLYGRCRGDRVGGRVKDIHSGRVGRGP